MNSLQPILIRPSFQCNTKWTKKRVKRKLRTRNCGEGYWMREPQISLDHLGEMYCSVHSVHAAIWYAVTMSRWIDCLSRSYRLDIYQISQMRTIWQSIIHTNTIHAHFAFNTMQMLLSLLAGVFAFFCGLRTRTSITWTRKQPAKQCKKNIDLTHRSQEKSERKVTNGNGNTDRR